RAQAASALLVLADRAEGAANIADVGRVEHEPLTRRLRRLRRPRGRVACHLLDLLSARAVPPRPPGRPSAGQISVRLARERSAWRPRSDYFAAALNLDVLPGRPSLEPFHTARLAADPA